MTPFERQLGHLFGGAAAPAHLMQQEQRSRQAVAALGSGLGQVALQGSSMVERLLQAPLAEPGADTFLNEVLQHVAQARTQAAAPGTRQTLAQALAPAAHRPMGAMGRQMINTAAMAGMAAKTMSNASQAFKARPARRAQQPDDPLARLVASVGSAAAASQVWQQRTARAGLAQAFASPLQVGAAALGSTLKAPGLAAVFGPALGQAVSGLPAFQPAARQGRPPTPTLGNAEPPDVLATIFQPVLPLLRATLNQLDGRGGQAPQAAGTAAPARRRPAGNPLAGAAGAGTALLPALAAPLALAGQAVASALQATAPVLPLAGALPGAVAQGLRGLAARANANANANASTAAAPRVATAAQPGATQAATPTFNPAAAGNDEALTEQLTRVLKREAQRDGIDVSDLQP